MSIGSQPILTILILVKFLVPLAVMLLPDGIQYGRYTRPPVSYS